MASEFAGVCPAVSTFFNPIHDVRCLGVLCSLCLPRYASDLTADQKDALLDVIRVRPHVTISSEIRREIVNSVERGAPRPEDGDDVAMS